MLAARLAATPEASAGRFLHAADQNLCHLEVQALHDVQALMRETTQRAAQAKADATPPRCPACGQPLSRCSSGHARTFQTRFGDITIRRTRGYCKRCRKWHTPADAALGLDDTADYSPAVQALAARAASKMPLADASVVLEQLSGVKLPPATLDREAKRQGRCAQRLRTQLDEQVATDKRQLELTLEPYQMILQLDAWHIRERDYWGQTARLRRQGSEPPSAGTVSIPARSSAWTRAGRPRANGPSSRSAAMCSPARGGTPCASRCTPRPCGGAWARPSACW